MDKEPELAATDQRIFLEIDQLYRKLEMSVAERLSRYEKAKEIFMQRDDLMIEYVTLLNLSGHYKEAYDFIMAHRFHPWEGGEGKVTTQYTTSLLELGKAEIAKEHWSEAKEILEKALVYPENLGEGKLEGTKDNHIHYYLGLAKEHLGENEAAKEEYEAASIGTDEPAGMMYYNDQPADMIYYQGLAKEKLGLLVEAKSRYYRLLDYGERHLYDKMRVEYFAVSLPDFMIFDDDLDKRNKTHCYYLMGLGYLGLGDKEKAAEAFRNAMQLDPTHLNAGRYLKMAEE